MYSQPRCNCDSDPPPASTEIVGVTVPIYVHTLTGGNYTFKVDVIQHYGQPDEGPDPFRKGMAVRSTTSHL